MVSKGKEKNRESKYYGGLEGSIALGLQLMWRLRKYPHQEQKKRRKGKRSGGEGSEWMDYRQLKNKCEERIDEEKPTLWGY